MLTFFHILLHTEMLYTNRRLYIVLILLGVFTDFFLIYFGVRIYRLMHSEIRENKKESKEEAAEKPSGTERREE